MSKKNGEEREERELEEWNKMKSMGKKKYVWSKGVLEFGVSMAILMLVFSQFYDEGFNLYSLSLSNHNFIRRLIINFIIFPIGGYFMTTLVWKRYKKKYGI